MAAVLVYGSLVLSLIVLAQKTFHADARLIGLIFSVGGGGALLGSLLAPWIRTRVAVGRIIVGVLAIMALAAALLALAPSPALAMVGWASIALTGPVYSVTVLSYRLGLVPDALQGRVTSVFRLLNMAGQPLSLAVGGLLLAALGPRPVLWITAAGGMLTAIVVSRTELCRA
jgi:MFS family permease